LTPSEHGVKEKLRDTVTVMRTYLSGEEALLTRLRIVQSEPADHFVSNLDGFGALVGQSQPGAHSARRLPMACRGRPIVLLKSSAHPRNPSIR
jgi:hypothetical protein